MSEPPPSLPPEMFRIRMDSGPSDLFASIYAKSINKNLYLKYTISKTHLLCYIFN